MVDEGHYGPAVVIAQAAVEVGVAMAVSFGLRSSGVPDALQTWIKGGAVRPWSPDNPRLRKLWTALTGGDLLTEAEGWDAYTVGVKLRHGFVHRAEEVPKDEAEQFIDVAQRIIAHVAHVMANLTLTEIAKRSS